MFFNIRTHVVVLTKTCFFVMLNWRTLLFILTFQCEFETGEMDQIRVVFTSFVVQMLKKLLVDVLNDLLYCLNRVIYPRGLVRVVVEDPIQYLREAVVDVSLDLVLQVLV